MRNTSREERVAQVRTALTAYLEYRHADFVRVLAIALLATHVGPFTKEVMGAARDEAEHILGHGPDRIQHAATPHVNDDYPYAELKFVKEGRELRLTFLYDTDDGTWDMYPSTGTTPSRQRARQAYEKFCARR